MCIWLYFKINDSSFPIEFWTSLDYIVELAPLQNILQKMEAKGHRINLKTTKNTGIPLCKSSHNSSTVVSYSGSYFSRWEQIVRKIWNIMPIEVACHREAAAAAMLQTLYVKLAKLARDEGSDIWKRFKFLFLYLVVVHYTLGGKAPIGREHIRLSIKHRFQTANSSLLFLLYQ